MYKIFDNKIFYIYGKKYLEYVLGYNGIENILYKDLYDIYEDFNG